MTIHDDFSYDGYGVLLQDESIASANPDKVDTQASSHLYAGEQFDTDLQQYYLRARWYNQNSGLFNRMDPYAGNNQDPQSLHKYLYCHANPVNATDPSGLWTTIQVVTVTGIIGLLAGALIGAYLGYRESGSFLSWTTLKYMLIGAFVGLGIGMAVGAAISVLAGIGPGLAKGAFSILTKAISKIIPQAIKLITTGTLGAAGSGHLIAFGIGILLGIGIGLIMPEEWLDPSAAVSGSLTTTFILSTIGASKVYALLGTTAPTIIASFVLGVNVGFWPVWGLRKLF
jgi:RHS repeat-associated protein